MTAPESLKKIGDWCFSYTKIHSLTLPNKVTLVDTSAFKYSPDLQEVKLGTADSFWYDESVLNRIENLKVVDATAYNGAIAFGTNGVNMPGRNLLIYTQQAPTSGVGKAAVAVAENGTIDSEQAIAAAPDFVLPTFTDKIATVGSMPVISRRRVAPLETSITSQRKRSLAWTAAFAGPLIRKAAPSPSRLLMSQRPALSAAS